MLPVLFMSGAAGILIVCFLIAFNLLRKSVPASQKEEMKQFAANQKTYRWNAAYTTLLFSFGFNIVLFIVSLCVKNSGKVAPYLFAASVLFTAALFICLCIWKNLFYVLSGVSLLNVKALKTVMLVFVCSEFVLSVCGMIFCKTAVFVYFIYFVLAVLAIYIIYTQKLKLDEGYLTIDNSDFAR